MKQLKKVLTKLLRIRRRKVIRKILIKVLKVPFYGRFSNKIKPTQVSQRNYIPKSQSQISIPVIRNFIKKTGGIWIKQKLFLK